LTCRARHEVATYDMTQWHESMDELNSSKTKGHKCIEHVKIWVGAMVCADKTSEVDAMHEQTERPITGHLGQQVKGYDGLCES